VEADRFLQLGTDPGAWIAKSVSLRRSADVIWESFFKAYIDCASKTKDGRPADADWDRFFGFLESAKFLYGLAAESAFKGAIVRERPTDVEFRLTADGAGKIQRATTSLSLRRKRGPLRAGKGKFFDRTQTTLLSDRFWKNWARLSSGVVVIQFRSGLERAGCLLGKSLRLLTVIIFAIGLTSYWTISKSP
jgi:hypothetical protein